MSYKKIFVFTTTFLSITNSFATELHLACTKGDLCKAKQLIEKGANLEAKNELRETPLHCAAECGHFEIVKLLVEKGANIEAKNDLCKKEQEEGPIGTMFNRCNCCWTALLYASYEGHKEIVKFLIKNKANKNHKECHRGRTALYWAKGKKHSEIVKLLEK